MIKDRTLPLNCTFVESDWRILASHWYPIAESITVGVEPIKAMLLDEPLVVYRIGEELIVARDVCPHRGVPLSMGEERRPRSGLSVPRLALRSRRQVQQGSGKPQWIHPKPYAALHVSCGRALWTDLDVPRSSERSSRHTEHASLGGCRVSANCLPSFRR